MTAALLDDAVDGGQAEAGALALRLRREEGFEQVPHDLRAHSATRVRHGQGDVRTRLGIPTTRGLIFVEHGLAGRDLDRSPVRHRLARIEDEVQEDLLDLHGIRVDRTFLRARDEDELHELACYAPEHRVERGDDRAQIEHLRLHHLAPAEREELPRQRGRV